MSTTTNNSLLEHNSMMVQRCTSFNPTMSLHSKPAMPDGGHSSTLRAAGFRNWPCHSLIRRSSEAGVRPWIENSGSTSGGPNRRW